MYFLRSIKSRFFNWLYQSRRKPLPYARNIENAALILQDVRYTPDRIDWVKHPKLTWGELAGDCEDIARLAAYLIEPFATPEIVDFLCKDPRLNHAICKYSTGVFNNKSLWYTTKSYKELAYDHAGNNVREILIEDPHKMKILRRIKCGD